MGLLFSLISAAHTMAFWQITNLKRSLSQIFIKYSFVFFLKAVAGNAGTNFLKSFVCLVFVYYSSFRLYLFDFESFNSRFLAVFWSFIALPSIAKVIKFLYLYVTHKVDKEIAKDFATAMIIEFMVQFLVIMSTPWQSFWAGYILSCVTISMIIHGFKEDTLREDGKHQHFLFFNLNLNILIFFFFNFFFHFFSSFFFNCLLQFFC